MNKIYQRIISTGEGKDLSYLLFAVLFVFAAIYYPLWLTHEQILTHDAIMWFGTYNYFMDCLLNNHLPLWDPYGQCGNSFFPNIGLLGLLDPIIMFYTMVVKLLPVSILSSFIYMNITRIVVAAVGAYFVYGHISGSKKCAKIGSVVFFMSLFSSSLHQNGFVNLFMIMPWILYFSLKYIDKIGQRHSNKYLYAMATTLGICLNIYIPVYTLFYLFLFYLVSFLTGAIKFSQLRNVFSVQRLKELILAGVIVLLFSAVPLAVFMQDVGSNGQLFPYLRAYTSNHGLDKVMVSDISTTALSGTFYKEEKITSTFLNLVQLIAPFHWEIKWKLMNHLHFQETFQFIGVIGILVIVCGVRFHSRFRYTVIIITVVIMLTFTGYKADGGAYFFHDILTIFFPPLRLIKVYESFLGAHLFNLCLLLTLGLCSLNKEITSIELYRKNLYSLPFFANCLIVYVISFFITFSTSSLIYPELKSLPFLSTVTIHLKSLIYLVLVLGAVFSVVYFLKRGWITRRVSFVCLVAIILTEMLVYNLPFNFRQITLSPNYLKSDDPFVHRPKQDVYENFRSIYIPAYFRFVTFQEALMKKGAVFPDIFHPMGNTLFVSKRYYEFITHVNKENIFAVSGLTSPKARFYEDAFVAKDRKDALDIISSVADENLRGSLLVIEMDSPVEYDFHHRDIMPYEYALPKRLPLEMKNPYGLYTHIFPLVKNFNKGQFSKIDPLAYGFPQNWPLYMMKDLNNVSNLSIPDELLTIDSNNTGRVVMTDEVGIPSVLLSGTSKNTNPVFMVPRRSYGEMAYNEGYPPHIYTVVDGSVISTKPFNGQCLFDTFSREVNVVDQKIKNISFSPNRASFSIQNQKPGFFYYADGWSPYWKAYDNNKPVPVLKANYNFKAVFLPPGEHIVTFVYRPVHYLFVLGCYCLGLILGGTLTIVLFTREYINKVKFSSSVPS